MSKKLDKWPPLLNGAECFDTITAIFRAFGKQVNVSLLPDILNSKPTSSFFGKKLIALRTFGLASVDKQVLTITALGMRIAAPVSADEKEAAKMESIRLMPVLADTLARFPGRLPERSNLSNLLQREYGVPAESGDSWAKFVIESIQSIPATVKDLIEDPTLSSRDVVARLTQEDQSTNPAPVGFEEIGTAATLLRVPLKDERYMMIPKDMTEKEAAFFSEWFQMWRKLHADDAE